MIVLLLTLIENEDGQVEVTKSGTAIPPDGGATDKECEIADLWTLELEKINVPGCAVAPGVTEIYRRKLA